MRTSTNLLALAALVAVALVPTPLSARGGGGHGGGHFGDGFHGGFRGGRGFDRGGFRGGYGYGPGFYAPQPQWDAFAAIMRQNAQTMEAQYRERQSRLASLSAIDDMRNYAAMSRLHADNVDKLLPAFEALYNTMSPEQRTATDQTFKNFQRNTARPGRT